MPKQCDEIDFELIGDDLQAVIVTLDPQEQVVAEAGAMLYMTQGIDMQTSMSVNENKGILGGILQGVGRALAGDSFFVTHFKNTGPSKASVAFAAPYPGKILPVDMAKHGGHLICQKDAFLCAAKGTNVAIEFSKKMGRGLFGGEGFILQRLSGDGMAFVHAGGTVFHRVLKSGEVLRVDTGCIVAFEPSVQYDIQFVGGFKNALFGGEGLFLATLTGPGNAYLQTLPFSRLADRIVASARTLGGGREDQGSLLGGLFMGDHR